MARRIAAQIGLLHTSLAVALRSGAPAEVAAARRAHHVGLLLHL